MIAPPRATSRREAFALIMVLAALAVMSLLLIALFGGSSHRALGAQNDAATAREKMLGDTVAALVIGQIEQATTQPNQAWISQPGLLRTYAANASRAPTASYKLYSSPQMIDRSGSLSFLAGEIPGDWNSTANQSVYTDLNEPMRPLLGAPIYPILDADAVNTVAGLASDEGHAVEMPVAWLYQLRDGTLGAPDAATESNPIVARIAFWTDDETSKIDINTAGESSAWNPPHTSSEDDVAWAKAQPARGEFARYPGHPANVSLSTVFGAGTAANLSSEQLLALTPRYASANFGADPITAASNVPWKTDRLYASLDELCFGATFDSGGRRVPNPITPAQLNAARFVLTAHSHSPETTLLGEPRVAIWPVSDALTDSMRATAADRAVAAAATVGPTAYFFQRHNAASATDDLDPTLAPGNLALFRRLIAAGNEELPGYGSSFLQKYPGAQWSQIMLEILDAIRGFNAVDPAPAPFGSFAQGDDTGLGRGLIVPLTTQEGGVPLHGIGRYPTLFGLTVVLYVSGFGFVSNPQDPHAPPDIDFEDMDVNEAAESWRTNFDLAAPHNRWSAVSYALVRAFVVPTTFQPGCGYPEVSEACDIQITGLDGLKATSNGSSGQFGFRHVAISHFLSDALTASPQERTWGGFEGPLAWKAAAQDVLKATGQPYAFAGTRPFRVPLHKNETGQIDAPGSRAFMTQNFTLAALPGVDVQIRDRKGVTVQTLKVDLPSFTTTAMPSISGEADHADLSDEKNPSADWAGNSAWKVTPSYYMSLKNRLRTTQQSRPLMIQAGDMTLSMEAATDLRLLASLGTVPSTFFQASAYVPIMGRAQRHNLRFADGTSAAWMNAPDVTLARVASPGTSAKISVNDWATGQPLFYSWSTNPVCSAPTVATSTSSSTVTMNPLSGQGIKPNISGDWDTGPGLEPDGALVNLPDAGTALDPAIAYGSLTGGNVGAATRRAPNALIPSPIVFGSLPAGIHPDDLPSSQPWRTLLFCPWPISGARHPGLASPPDYLLLDRFWMPVVEPYGISTRLETAGKINLNDQIAPFTYLHRNTALRALLHDLRLPAISPHDVLSYKIAAIPPTPPMATIWKPIDETATLQQIEKRFAMGDAYLTEGEICSVPLIPLHLNSDLTTYWTNYPNGGGYLTGDNLREWPYNRIYSRLTTRSNSYTVHMRVQVLQKLPDDSPPGVWREGTDRVLGDWRGSCEIERYLDPAAPAPADGKPLGPYKFRIVSARRFMP